MHQKHKNTKKHTYNKLKQLKNPRFGHLFQPLSWKQSGSILNTKDK